MRSRAQRLADGARNVGDIALCAPSTRLDVRTATLGAPSTKQNMRPPAFRARTTEQVRLALGIPCFAHGIPSFALGIPRLAYGARRLVDGAQCESDGAWHKVSRRAGLGPPPDTYGTRAMVGLSPPYGVPVLMGASGPKVMFGCAAMISSTMSK